MFKTSCFSFGVKSSGRLLGNIFKAIFHTLCGSYSIYSGFRTEVRLSS